MKKRWMALALIVVLTIAFLPGSVLVRGERTICVGVQGSGENDGLTADAPLLSLEAARFVLPCDAKRRTFPMSTDAAS